MKTIKFLTFSFFCILMQMSCTNNTSQDKMIQPSYTSNKKEDIINPNESPQSVMEALFNAAKTGELGILAFLIPPDGIGDTDGDVERICSLGTRGSDSLLIIHFRDEFSKAKIIGEPVIHENEAEVNFIFGPNLESSETMKLQKISDKWYLSSF